MLCSDASLYMKERGSGVEQLDAKFLHYVQFLMVPALVHSQRMFGPEEKSNF